MIRYIFRLFLSFFLIGSSWATIYFWQDLHGVSHFSDLPHPGADLMDLDSDLHLKAKLKKPAHASDVSDDTSKILILEPKTEATLRNSQGLIKIKLAIETELSHYKVQILLDEVPVHGQQKGIYFYLEQIDRGVHTLRANLLNQQDKVLSSSGPIKIYVFRPRIKRFK